MARVRRIPDDHFRAACRVADDVNASRVTRAEGIAQLARLGLNSSSATDYINDYRCLMEGREFNRTMSKAAMTYFIGEILRLHGPSAHANAVKSLGAHVAYYERHYKITSPLREVFERLSTLSDVSEIDRAYREGVERSQRDGRAARLKRLESASPIPVAVTAKTVVYLRNCDVVAEVLERAEGRCEVCMNLAPFTRRSNNQPYLEVHHKIRLADGGKDTVENALALCPNCHRKAHYGSSNT